MFDFTKVNKGETLFTYQLPEGAEFKKLQDMEVGESVHVRGLFISKAKTDEYDDHPVAVSDEWYVDLPPYMTETVKTIMSDENAVNAINEGEAGFKIVDYVKKKGKGKGKTFKAVVWINWPPVDK